MEQKPVREIVRLSPEMYKELCKGVSAIPTVTGQTTELQAGFMLGVQHVLYVLREKGIANV